MTDADTKKRILERRRRFMAAALTGVGVVSCTPAGGPEKPSSAAPVLVSVEKPPDAAPMKEEDASTALEPEPPPTVCLSDEPIDPEAVPCLSIPPTNP